jgi:hypothetical protein
MKVFISEGFEKAKRNKEKTFAGITCKGQKSKLKGQSFF